MWESNYSITKLFDNRVITIYNNEIPSVAIQLKAPSIRQQLNDLGLLKLLSMTEDDKVKAFKESFPKLQIQNSLDLINNLVANPIFTNSKEFKGISIELLDTLKIYIEDIGIGANRVLKVKDYVIDPELWEQILYLIKISCGEKVEKPRKFADEKTRLLYEKQKEYEKKIQQMKKNESGSEDSLIKIFLLIAYAFPNISFENLFEMTMSQVNFLQTYAGNVCAYQLESAAYANGNLKKPPVFFLDEKK